MVLATGRPNRAPRIVHRWPPGRALVAVARGPPTWCLVPPTAPWWPWSARPGARCLDLVPGLADLVAVDLVAVDLVAVDLVAVDLVAVDLVPGTVARVTWCAPWWPPTWCRGRWLQADPGGPGAQKTGRVASCAGISPFLHGQFHVKQFSGPAIKGPLCQQTQLVSKYLKI